MKKNKERIYLPESGDKIKLTPLEISELIADTVLYVIILIFFNATIIILTSLLLRHSSDLSGIIFNFKMLLTNRFNNKTFLSLEKFLILLLIVIDFIILFWRLKSKYEGFKVRHVLDQVRYISQGNYDHLIPFKFNNSLGEIVDSINKMIKNTARIVEEERKTDKIRDELISNISHDLRTPLTSIIGYLGLIENRQYHSEEDVLKFVNTAYLKSKQLKVLVDDLFEFTKVRHPSAKLNFKEINLSAMLAQFAIDFTLEAEKKNIAIDVRVDPEKIMINADPDRLARVFNNLLANALKYGKNATQIILSAEKIKNEIVVIIKNNGEQIPKSALNKLFDRFFRVEESRSLKTGGTGLGLAITQTIVTQHGGYIFADSNPNWTSFVMHFPQVKEDLVPV